MTPTLVVVGDVATDWMHIAQAFAGGADHRPRCRFILKSRSPNTCTH